MKKKTALVLTAAGVLLTGSAALAVNVQTLNGPPAGATPANTVLLPQNSTTTPPPHTSTPTASTVEDRSPASSPSLPPVTNGATTPHPPPLPVIGLPPPPPLPRRHRYPLAPANPVTITAATANPSRATTSTQARMTDGPAGVSALRQALRAKRPRATRPLPGPAPIRGHRHRGSGRRVRRRSQ